MSEDRDLDSVVTVSADGISVEKRFEREDFAVPAVQLTVRSDREQPTTVRIVDHVPEEFPMDSVGFHPEYYNDDWTAFKDHRVEFERELGPGEELVTVYGVRLSESDEIESFMGEPELVDVESESEDVPEDPLASIAGDSDGSMDGNTITDIVSEDGNQVVRDVLTGSRDSLPGLDADEGEPASPEIGASEETADSETATATAGADPLGELGASADESDPLADPATESDPEPEVLTTDSPAESDPSVEPTDEDIDPEPADLDPEPADIDPEPTDVSIDPEPPEDDEPSEIVTAEPDLPAVGNVASTLAEEIRDGSVSEGDLAVLRQELDVPVPESTNVRIRHLQARVEDLTAYTEALEAFIDDNGSAKEVLEEFEGFEDEVAALGEQVDDLESQIGDVQTPEVDGQSVEDLANSVESLEDGQSDTDERLEALEAEMASISDRIEANNDELQAVRDDLADVRELESEIESIRGDVAAISNIDDRLDAIDRLEERLVALEEQDGDLQAAEHLQEEINTIRADFADLEELVGANTEDVTAINKTLSNVEAELAGVLDVEGDLQSIDERLADLSESLEATGQSLESDVTDLHERVESITDDVEEIRAWRDQLKGVFAAGDG